MADEAVVPHLPVYEKPAVRVPAVIPQAIAGRPSPKPPVKTMRARVTAKSPKHKRTK